MPRGALEVIEYVPRQAFSDAVSAPATNESKDLWTCFDYRPLASFAAAFVAVALHVLFVAPVLWAGGFSQHRQQQRYRGDPADLQWVVLAESIGDSASVSPNLPSAPSLTRIGLTDLLPTPPSVSQPAEASSNRAQADGETGLGEKYGRYLSQIRARIDRAWQRPRSAIGGPIFQCQVQVDQDSGGRVQEVTLLECNGDAPWQLSLVHAIQAASPLPAPSDRAVFVHHVLLAFRAMAYAPGEPAELYEPVRVTPAGDEQSERDASSLSAFQALRKATQAHKSRVLKLQIEGSKVDVEPDRQ